MPSPTINGATILALTSANFDAGTNQIHGIFTSSGSSGLLVMAMSVTGTTGYAPFLGVASAGLSFTRRSTAQLTPVNGLHLQADIWTAPFSSALSQRVNFDFLNGSWNNGAFTVFEVNGLFSDTDPFDSNGAEPATASATASPLPTQHYTTDQPDDLLLYLSNGVDSNTQPPNQTGWTLVIQNIDTFGVAYCNMRISTKSVSAKQTMLAIDSNNRGIGYIDALTGDSKTSAYQTFVTSICT